jgi:hypothetical protein
MEFSKLHSPIGLHGLLRGWTYFLYVDDVRTSQETPMGPPLLVTGTALLFICALCSYLTGNTPISLDGLIRDSFRFLYADDGRTKQKTYLLAYTACYGNTFTFYTYMIFVRQRKHTNGPPRRDTAIALLLYM